MADANANCFSYDQVENKDFKFNLRVTIIREVPELDEEDEELQEIVGDDDTDASQEVEIRMEVMQHPAEKDQIGLVFRQNGKNWVDSRDFNLAMVNIAEFFADFANEE